MMLNRPVYSNHRFIVGSKRFSRAASAFVMLIGALVLVGWIFDIYRLKSIYGDITVKANTSLAFLSAGASLWLLNSDAKNGFSHRAGIMCAALAALIGGLTLSQHVFGWNLGIDELLFTEPSGALATASPGRMGPPASTSFMLSGIALMLLHARRRFTLAQSLSIIVCLWALFAIIGYMYEAQQLYGIARYTGIAFPSALSLLLLGLGLLAASVTRGVVSVISSDLAGGLMARRLLIAALAVPALLGWAYLRQQRAGYYDLGFGTALLVLSIIIILIVVIWQSGARLNHVEQQRLQAEASVREKEEGMRRQAALIELSHEPIFVWDMESGILEWNKGSEQLYGYTKQEAIMRASHELLKTRFPSSMDACIETLEREGYWSGELRHTTRDGAELVVEARLQLMESQGKRLVLEAARDITERKRAEEAMSFLAAIVESSDDAIFGKTIDGTIVSWNAGAEKIYGYAADEIVGQHASILAPPHLKDEITHILEKLKQGEPTHHLETVRVRKDATLIDVALTISPIRDGSGNITGASTTARDITELKRGEAEREHLLAREQVLRAEAERANRLKDEFLATVSHELRTPLNAVLGWATMLRRGKFDEASLARALETIERNAKTQAQLIEDLLDVSRVITGKLRLDIQPVELTSVIKAAIDSIRPAADAKQIQLYIILDTLADRIAGDATRLQQVVWNLLSNAVKFTPKGGSVQVRLERVDSEAQITVSDTGEGIAADFLSYVFDRFQQADGTTTRRQGGLGLGLAIARHLVEMHGGSIRAHSSGLGQGASFSVRLPLVAARSTEAFANDNLNNAPSTDGTLSGADPAILYGLRILAVDDEPDTRDMLKGVLEQYGANVITAASAKEAYEALPGWKPDVIVSDIGMPEEDGYSLIRKIRALGPEQGGNTPAIALTGYVRVEERMRALKAGFQMFVSKPVEADELTSIIASLVGRASRGIVA